MWVSVEGLGRRWGAGVFQVGWQDWQDVAKVGKGQRSSGRQFLFDSPANSCFFSYFRKVFFPVV